MIKRLFVYLALAAVVAACATSPLGRKQLKLFPEEQIAAMGAASFQEIKQQSKPVQPSAITSYVTCVADHITSALDSREQWEVEVFDDETPNAFALPGGKIGVHTGLLEVASNQHQLAAVIGHEVAHVRAHHANERISTAYATQTGLDLLSAVTGEPSARKQQLFALLGLGAQVGILLPFSRTQEREADLLGLDLMAEAGFDPREAVSFWKNMEAAGGNGPPEFLSTHPSGETRMSDLADRMSKAMALFNEARAAGKAPKCQPAP